MLHQSELNNRFSLERKDEILKQSHFLDQNGRKVIFYRFMRQEIFEKIFDSGIILPSDNVPKYS